MTTVSADSIARWKLLNTADGRREGDRGTRYQCMSVRKKMRRAETSCFGAIGPSWSPPPPMNGNETMHEFKLVFLLLARKIGKKPGTLTKRSPLHSILFILSGWSMRSEICFVQFGCDNSKADPSKFIAIFCRFEKYRGGSLVFTKLQKVTPKKGFFPRFLGSQFLDWTVPNDILQ